MGRFGTDPNVKASKVSQGAVGQFTLCLFAFLYGQLDSSNLISYKFESKLCEWQVPRHMQLLANTKSLPPVYVGPTRVLLS